MPNPAKYKGYDFGRRGIPWYGYWDLRVRSEVWQLEILEKFIKKRELPESWGSTLAERYETALQVLVAAINPAILETEPDEYGLHLNAKQFAKPFINAPDYFVDLMVFARKEASSLSMEATIAKMFSELNDKLPRKKDGSLESYEKLAEFIVKQPGFPSKWRTMHPNTIQKALKVFFKRSASDEAFRSAAQAKLEPIRNAYEKYRETPACKNWYAQRHERESSAQRMEDHLRFETRRPPRNVYCRSFKLPLEENEDFKQWWVEEYIAYGIEPRPHDAPPWEDIFEFDMEKPEPAPVLMVPPRKAEFEMEKSERTRGFELLVGYLIDHRDEVPRTPSGELGAVEDLKEYLASQSDFSVKLDFAMLYMAREYLLDAPPKFKF